MSKGLFITFEGPDGSGKTTLVNKIAEWLKSENYDLLLTKEPGSPHNEVCKSIREIVLDPDHKIDSEAEIYLMMADRCNHVNQVILPALNDGKMVISDRYIDSTYAYQGFGRRYGEKEAIEYIDLLNEKSTNGLVPDMTIILMVDPEVGLSRATKTEFGKSDRFESERLDFHKRLCEGYKRLFVRKGMKRNFFIIDTTDMDKEIVFQKAKSGLEYFLKKENK